MLSGSANGRAAGLIGAGAVSACAALVLVFELVTPESIAGVGTLELIGLLSLLVMPVAVFAAHRRSARQSSEVAASAGELSGAHVDDPAPAPASRARVEMIVRVDDGARGRPADAHRRRHAADRRERSTR